jgi:hemolysin activation/secretion protein
MYKNFNFSFFSKIQLSSVNLLPSEQLGIGGYYSVRGFDEHEFNEDNGVVLSSEMTLPPFGIIKYMSKKKIKDSIQLLGFIDYAVGWPHRRVKGEARSRYLLGAGPGLRYVIENFLSVRLDWGYRLHKKRGSKLHFGVMINY